MNWLKNFKPRMVIFDMGDRTVVKAVCANRVYRVAFRVALKKAGNDKRAKRLLGGGYDKS